MGSYELPDCLRVSIGLEEELRTFSDTLEAHLKSA